MNVSSVSPVSTIGSKRTPSFGDLKFELDRSSKEYLLQLGKKENIPSTDILEIAVTSDDSVNRLTNRANLIAKSLVENQSFLKGKKLEEIWPEKTVVKVCIKPRRHSDKMILDSYFNGELFAQENEENTFNPRGDDRKEVNTFAFWRFLGDLRERESLSFFVEKMLKKQLNYQTLKNNAELVKKSEEERDEEYAKNKLKGWVEL